MAAVVHGGRSASENHSWISLEQKNKEGETIGGEGVVAHIRL